MPVDPAVRAYLDGLAAAGIVPVNEVPIADSRRLANELAPRLFGEPDPVASIDDWTVPGPGGPIAIRRYLPAGAAGPLPALVWYHGGGCRAWLKVGRNTLTEDTRFQLDFNTAFPTGPARPHGIAMK